MFSGESVQAFYDSIAERYEELLTTPEIDSQLIPTIIPLVRAHGVTQGSILDIGCGPGNLEAALGQGFEYTGIDIAPNMLALAERRGYRTIRGHAEEVLPHLPSKSYDYTFAISSLHFVADIEAILAQIERVTRKGMLVTLPNITDRYRERFPVANATHNHFTTNVQGVTQEVTILAWKSPTTGEHVSERIIYCSLE